MQGVVYIFLIITLAAADDEIHVQEFRNEPGIYFADIGHALISTSDWKLVLFYNLTSYWQEWKHLQEVEQQLIDTCSRDLNTTTYIRNCKELIQPISYLMENIDSRNPMLQAVQNRKRRAPLDFVGNLMGDLFGVLDQRDAQRYHDQIQELASGTLELQSLVQQQTHVLDLTTSILRKEKEMITKHYQILRKEVAAVIIHEEFLDTLFQLSSATFLVKDCQSDLIDLIADVHHGRATTRLLPPIRLEEQLKELQTLIPPSTRIPTNKNNWAQIYKLLTIKAGIAQNQIIFEVRLPLLQREEFQVFNAIPVPTQHNDRFIYIEPEFRYVLVHQHRTWYYPITGEALKECKPWEVNARVCTLQGPMYNMQVDSTSCEAALLARADTALALCQVRSMTLTSYFRQIQDNQWIMVLPKEIKLDLQCQTRSRPVTLQGSGILTLAPGCSLRGRTILLTSHAFYTTRTSHVAFIPTFNLTHEIQTSDVLLSSDEIEEGLTELQQTVSNLQHREPWSKMNPHNIGHYVTSAGMFLFLLTLVLLICKYRKKSLIHQSRRRRRPTQVITTDQDSPGNLI